MIDVHNITKAYGTIEALRGVSFSVGAGEIVGLLGPNGAGKSTAIKIITGYLHADDGDVQVDGFDVFQHPQAVQARLGYLAENNALYTDLSVQAYLRLMAEYRSLAPDEHIAHISEAIYATGLQDYRARPISSLSKGLKQRVGLAQAILHKPKLLILDEPTVGLDPTQIVEIRHLIKRLSEHSTILFSSHILSEVEAVCDRVVIIMNGLVRADATLDELASTKNTVLVLEEDVEGAIDILQQQAGVGEVQTFFTRNNHPAYRIISEQEISSVIYQVARKHDWDVREIRQDNPTLESVFNELATTPEVTLGELVS